MIWTAVVRAGAVLSMIVAVKDLHDLATREIKPHRIYNTADVARFLNTDRRNVIRLLRAGEMRGKQVGGNYRIPGAAILEYLQK